MRTVAFSAVMRTLLWFFYGEMLQSVERHLKYLLLNML